MLFIIGHHFTPQPPAGPSNVSPDNLDKLVRKHRGDYGEDLVQSKIVASRRRVSFCQIELHEVESGLRKTPSHSLNDDARPTLEFGKPARDPVGS